jgi:gluconolactonase
MHRELLAEGLGWAEGPAVLPDGRVCFVETFRSRVSVWERDAEVRQYAYTAGGPNACILGTDGALYVCQNGGTVGPWRAPEMVAPSIQRIDREGGGVETIATSVDGITLNGPNDLVFGPDGRLYFTDPGVYNPEDPQPSYIFSLSADGSGKLLVELDPPTFPNGIAIEPDGGVVWAESYTGMVRRIRPAGGDVEDVGQLPGERPVADGLAVASDGRLFVTTVNGGGIEVLHADGRYDQFIEVGDVPTNCIFDGSSLYVTDAGMVADTPDAAFGGQLWLVETDTEGGPTWYGSVS